MPNEISGRLDASSESRFAIVVSRYNEGITSKLLSGAVQTLTDHSVRANNIDVVWVPGAWEIPLATQQLAAGDEFAAIICLGAVIKGETTHDEHINRFVSLSLGQLSLEMNVPISLGVLTCNSLDQARARAGGNVGNKGIEAAQAALEMSGLMRELMSEN